MELKVYLPAVGWDYEGEEVLGVFTDIEGARDALKEKVGGDYEEIQVFALNGGRFYDDPEEYFKKRR